VPLTPPATTRFASVLPFSPFFLLLLTGACLRLQHGPRVAWVGANRVGLRQAASPLAARELSRKHATSKTYGAGGVIFCLLEIYKAIWWASYLISFRILGVSSGSDELLNHSRVHCSRSNSKTESAPGVTRVVTMPGSWCYQPPCVGLLTMDYEIWRPRLWDYEIGSGL
jgi:hypothetical protein